MKRLALALFLVIAVVIGAAWQLILNLAGNYATDIVPLATARALVSGANDAIVANAAALIALLGLVVAIAAYLFWRRSSAPQHSALSWRGGVDTFDWNDDRSRVGLRATLTATADQDVTLGASRVAIGAARIAHTQPRRAVRAGQSYAISLEFGPFSTSAPGHTHALVEQRYRLGGDLRERRAQVLLHIVYRWGAAGIEPEITEYDDGVRVTDAEVVARCERHFARNQKWYQDNWATPARQVAAVTLRPSSGAAPDLRLDVTNTAVSPGVFTCRCRLLRVRNDRSGQPLRTTTYTLPWTDATPCSTRIPANATATVLIATWLRYDRDDLGEIHFPECRPEGATEFHVQRWDLHGSDPLPEFDLEITVSSDDQVAASEQYTLRPAQRRGPLELVPMRPSGIEVLFDPTTDSKITLTDGMHPGVHTFQFRAVTREDAPELSVRVTDIRNVSAIGAHERLAARAIFGLPYPLPRLDARNTAIARVSAPHAIVEKDMSADGRIRLLRAGADPCIVGGKRYCLSVEAAASALGVERTWFHVWTEPGREFSVLHCTQMEAGHEEKGQPAAPEGG